jgi:hypothetical protein
MMVWRWPDIMPGDIMGSRRESTIGWEHGTLKNAVVCRERRKRRRRMMKTRVFKIMTAGSLSWRCQRGKYDESTLLTKRH